MKSMKHVNKFLHLFKLKWVVPHYEIALRFYTAMNGPLTARTIADV